MPTLHVTEQERAWLHNVATILRITWLKRVTHAADPARHLGHRATPAPRRHD